MKRRKITEWSAEELGTMMLAFGKMCEEAKELRNQYKIGGFTHIACDGECELNVHLFASDDDNIIEERISICEWVRNAEEAQSEFDEYIAKIKAWIDNYRTMTEAEKLAKRIETKQAELAELKKQAKELNKKK